MRRIHTVDMTYGLIAECCRVLQRGVVRCSGLQCVTVSCNVSQCVAVTHGLVAVVSKTFYT